MNDTHTASQHNRLLRRVALLSWIIIVLAHLVFFLFDQASDYAQMLVPCDGALQPDGPCNFLAISSAEVAVLASWGLTLRAYALAMTAGTVVLLLVYWALAALILWRQGISRLGLTISLALIIVPIIMVSGDNDWSASEPLLLYLAVTVAILGSAIMIAFLYLIPNGRFSPKWAPLPLVATVLLLGAITLDINGILTLSSSTLSLLQSATVALVLLGAGLQIYRYLRDASPSERQQTKWILSGVLTFVLSIIGWILIFGRAITIPPGGPRLLANLLGWIIIGNALLLMLPATITIAILRYRLWDIDLIVRKTLIYALLSGLLALVYLGTVILLQTIFDSFSGQQSPLAIVISTLVIAALFAPLRRRVQTFIDRRFFRQKYDAQQVLAHFTQTSQDEVSLEALTTEIDRVVQETMQPQTTTIWLKNQTK